MFTVFFIPRHLTIAVSRCQHYLPPSCGHVFPFSLNCIYFCATLPPINVDDDDDDSRYQNNFILLKPNRSRLEFQSLN